MYSARDEGHPLLITGREISPRDVYVRVAPFEPQAVDLHFPEHEFSLHRLHIAPFVAGFSDAWEKALTNGVFTTHARQERLLVQRLLSAVEYMEDFHARCSGGRSEGRSPTVEVLWRMAMGEHPLRLGGSPDTHIPCGEAGWAVRSRFVSYLRLRSRCVRASPVGPCCPEDRWLQQQEEYKRKQAGQSSGPCSYVPPMQSRCGHS